MRQRSRRSREIENIEVVAIEAELLMAQLSAVVSELALILKDTSTTDGQHPSTF